MNILIRQLVNHLIIFALNHMINRCDANSTFTWNRKWTSGDFLGLFMYGFKYGKNKQTTVEAKFSIAAWAACLELIVRVHKHLCVSEVSYIISTWQSLSSKYMLMLIVLQLLTSNTVQKCCDQNIHKLLLDNLIILSVIKKLNSSFL